jgi:hypothetical protein
MSVSPPPTGSSLLANTDYCNKVNAEYEHIKKTILSRSGLVSLSTPEHPSHATTITTTTILHDDPDLDIEVRNINTISQVSNRVLSTNEQQTAILPGHAKSSSNTNIEIIGSGSKNTNILASSFYDNITTVSSNLLKKTNTKDSTAVSSQSPPAHQFEEVGDFSKIPDSSAGLTKNDPLYDNLVFMQQSVVDEKINTVKNIMDNTTAELNQLLDNLINDNSELNISREENTANLLNEKQNDFNMINDENINENLSAKVEEEQKLIEESNKVNQENIIDSTQEELIKKSEKTASNASLNSLNKVEEITKSIINQLASSSSNQPITSQWEDSPSAKTDTMVTAPSYDDEKLNESVQSENSELLNDIIQQVMIAESQTEQLEKLDKLPSESFNQLNTSITSNEDNSMIVNQNQDNMANNLDSSNEFIKVDDILVPKTRTHDTSNLEINLEIEIEVDKFVYPSSSSSNDQGQQSYIETGQFFCNEPEVSEVKISFANLSRNKNKKTENTNNNNNNNDSLPSPQPLPSSPVNFELISEIVKGIY